MTKTELMFDLEVIEAKLANLNKVLSQFKTKNGHIKSLEGGLGRTQDKKIKFFILKLGIFDEQKKWEILLPLSVLDDTTHIVGLINLIDEAHQLYYNTCVAAVDKVERKYFELFKELYPYDQDVHSQFS